MILNRGISSDDKASGSIIRELGAELDFRDDSLIVKSRGVRGNRKQMEEITLHCGESGLGIRMFTPIAAVLDRPVRILGTGSLAARPMNFFDDVLPRLGVKITSAGGRLPLEIEGPLQATDIEIDGSLSSQFLTGLLMAYSAAEAGRVGIKVNGLKSKPYIDLTLSVMRAFGLQVPENRGYETFYFSGIMPAEQPERIEYTVEGDWSGAAFLLVAGAITGGITVKGLDVYSTQADRAVMQALKYSGCHLLTKHNGIEAAPGNLQAFDFDAGDCPDLFPPLVALAACCKGTSAIAGVERLLHKESNRALTLRQEFGKMGVNISISGTRMLIEGGSGIQAAQVDSHHDHRIAMACAVAGLRANGEVCINNAEAIDKSYPAFYRHLSSLGASLSLNG